MTRSRYTGRIRIKKTPHGEAPEWVRQAWVGLILPCAPVMVFEKERKGVLSNEDCKKDGGYIINVPQKTALRLLARKSPKAADWWKQHGYPNEQEEDFGFKDAEVEILEGEHQVE